MYLNHFRLRRQRKPFFCRHLSTLITALELIVRLFCAPRPFPLASQAIINAAIRIKSIWNVSRTRKATLKNINAYLKSSRQQHKQQSSRVSLVCAEDVCVLCLYACVCICVRMCEPQSLLKITYHEILTESCSQLQIIKYAHTQSTT